MIPLAVPNLAGNEEKYLANCVASTFVSSVGPYVTKFEEMVAGAAGAPYSVATSAGTTALHAALLTVGVRRDDLVICPALTFVASANAISHCGAVPWLFDVDRDSWTLDPRQLAEEVARNTEVRAGERIHKASGRRVSAIVPVFTLGIPADMDAIIQVAKNSGLRVVVDGAAALGATYRGHPSGALGADFTMYSFNGNKTVTAGGGGAVACFSKDLMQAFRHLTTTARVGTDYDHDLVGYNYRMTNLQAAVGCAQMEQLDTFVAAKRRIADTYHKAFQDISGVKAFPNPNWGQSAAWFSGFYIDSLDGGTKGAGLRRSLRERDIDARPFWKPMHLQAPYKNAPRASLPVSEYLWDKVVTLPCSTNLTSDDQNYVVDEVRAWCRAGALCPTSS